LYPHNQGNHRQETILFDEGFTKNEKTIYNAKKIKPTFAPEKRKGPSFNVQVAQD
jgi:hypothetical protein